jgi:hypothetical protein
MAVMRSIGYSSDAYFRNSSTMVLRKRPYFFMAEHHFKEFKHAPAEYGGTSLI